MVQSVPNSSAGESHTAEDEPPSLPHQKQCLLINTLTTTIQEPLPGSPPLNQWNDWKWQIANSITDYRDLKSLIHFTDDEIDLLEKNRNLLPLRITPYYLELLKQKGHDSPLRKSVIPDARELIVSPCEMTDPLSEDESSPVEGLVHRYPDRVLFLVTGFCSTYCRYCTRSRMVGTTENRTLDRIANCLEYLRFHTEVRDVILSGGDPLTMTDEYLDFLLAGLRSIPHIEIIRIGTKIPAVLPQRITDSLINVLKKYHPLFMSLHFTHPDELTPESQEACRKLADAGIPLGSQTVLLQGINDQVGTMRKLVQGLLKVRVRPYYLYQCDPIPGSSHFRTPVSRGIEIIKGLRGFTSGYAIPHFVIDAPGGGGKIPILPEYIDQWKDGEVVMKNYLDQEYRYPDLIE